MDKKLKEFLSSERRREVLRAIESIEGSATTSGVRDITGLGNQEVRYEFKQLEEFGLIEKEYDDSLTVEGRPPMTVVRLTNEGSDLFEDDLLTKVKEVKRMEELTPEEKLDRLKEDFEEFRYNEWIDFVDWARDIEDRLKELETRLDL